MPKERIKGLNRRAFRRNLKKVLKSEIKNTVNGEGLEIWVADYMEHCEVSGVWGWYEIKSHEHKNSHSESIKTN